MRIVELGSLAQLSHAPTPSLSSPVFHTQTTPGVRTTELETSLQNCKFTAKFRRIFKTPFFGAAHMPLSQYTHRTHRGKNENFEERRFSSPSSLSCTELWLNRALTIPDTYLLLNYPQPHIFLYICSHFISALRLHSQTLSSR